MSEVTRCPHCGALDALSAEVRRIRELAEAQAPGLEPAGAGRTGAREPAAESQRRIAELTREVNELRATVARLRGSAPAPLARAV